MLNDTQYVAEPSAEEAISILTLLFPHHQYPVIFSHPTQLYMVSGLT
jgi:hypothetical protein